MTATPPSATPPPGAITGLLGQVLAFVDKPWKAAAVVVLVIVGGIGWTLYEHRDEFVEAWLTPVGLGLNIADVPAALDTLNANGGPDLLQIWSVDLALNSQKFIAARRKDGERPVVPNPRRLPVMIATSDVKALVNILEGSPVCADVDSGGSPIMRRLAERGQKRACAVPIPPSPEAFVGIIYLSWREPVDASTESVAVSAAREIAGKLVTR